MSSDSELPQRKRKLFSVTQAQANAADNSALTEPSDAQPSKRASRSATSSLPPRRTSSRRIEQLATPVLPPADAKVDLLCQRLTHFLSSPLARKFCTYEWFYSPVDQSFFASNELATLVAQQGEALRATAPVAAWRALRHRGGRPRRLSPAFLAAERRRLAAHRRAVADAQRSGVLDDQALSVLHSVRLPSPLPVRARVVCVDESLSVLRTGSVLARTSNAQAYVIRFDDRRQPDAVVPSERITPYGDTHASRGTRYAYVPKQSPISRALQGIAPPSSSAGAHAAQQSAADTSNADTTAGDDDRQPLEAVRPLATLLYTLRRKELLVRELQHMHDTAAAALAAAPDNDSAPFDEEFRNDYAWLLAQLQQTNATLEPALESLSTSSFKQRATGRRGGRRASSSFTSSGNDTRSWYTTLAGLCRDRAKAIVARAITRRNITFPPRSDDARVADVSPAVRDMVIGAVALFLHLAVSCERALTPPEMTLAVFAASTAMRPRHEANNALFASIDDLLFRFQRVATSSRPPTPISFAQPSSSTSQTNTIEEQ